MRETTLPAVNHNIKTLLFNGGSNLLYLTALALMSLSRIKGLHDTDYKVHANIIYRFTKYIDWPPDKKTGDFIIGIFGDSPLYEDLKNVIANKTVGSQKIVVLKIPLSASTFNCHILFVGEEESGSMKKIAGLTAGVSTLIVSESEGLCRKGSCINFIMVDERLKLEINKGNIEQRNLRIASELLDLGIIIK